MAEKLADQPAHSAEFRFTEEQQQLRTGLPGRPRLHPETPPRVVNHGVLGRPAMPADQRRVQVACSFGLSFVAQAQAQAKAEGLSLSRWLEGLGLYRLASLTPEPAPAKPKKPRKR